jgi:hypothetical protein
MSINHPGIMDADLRVTTFITDLQREYIPNDIFDSLSDYVINPSDEAPASIPEVIYLKLKADVDKGQETRWAMIKDFSDAPVLGARGDLRGHEEDFVLKHSTMHYGEACHGFNVENYGYYAKDKEPYGVFEQGTENETRYWKQYFGKMRRQALLQLQSENLEDAPHYLPSGFSPNWIVPNLRWSSQPVYVADAYDWIDTIVDSLLVAGTGVNACASLNFFIKLETWARTEKFITPIDFGDGTDGYILTLPTPQCDWLEHLVQEGNAGKLWRDAANMSAEVLKKYPSVRGRFKGLMIIEDQNYPTLTLGGSASNSTDYKSDESADYTLTAQYRGMGRAADGSSDPRDKTANARQVGFLIGKAALCEWMRENFHYEYEYENYDRFYGTGVFLSVGIKQVIYDETDGDATTLQQDSSVVVPFAAPPETYYYTAAA